MRSSLSGLALALAIAAVGVAAYALTQERRGTSDLEARLEALEERLARMGDPATEPASETDEVAEPTLRGPFTEFRPSPRDVANAGTTSDPRSADAPARPADGEGPSEETVEEIREIVDEAVAKKAAQIRSMQDKKPKFDVFAKTLELTEEQRVAAEREIVASQHEIKAILEVPTADGTNFVDELVEVMAEGMARPGEKTGRGMKLFGRLLTENVPGTDETYAARAEAVKERLRASFRRSWSEEQYATFESWQMDPTEVDEVEGSPWKELEARVIERAKDLGADVPDAD